MDKKAATTKFVHTELKADESLATVQFTPGKKWWYQLAQESKDKSKAKSHRLKFISQKLGTVEMM